MIKGRFNSEGSIKTGLQAFDSAGHSWVALEKVATRTSSGVYIVSKSSLAKCPARKAEKKTKTAA